MLGLLISGLPGVIADLTLRADPETRSEVLGRSHKALSESEREAIKSIAEASVRRSFLSRLKQRLH
jgi:hypothetical protein